MAFMQQLNRLDGRHKLAILMAIGAWGVSVYFSQVGFSLDASKALWLGWFLGFLVTTVELVFNSHTHKLSLTLILVGILCYGYGIWTNVTGFWAFQNPNVAFVWNNQQSILSWFVGLVLEVLPEPLFMWGIGAELDGDLIGNLMGLWSGKLSYADPANQSKPKQDNQPKPNQQPHQNPNPQFRPTQKQQKHSYTMNPELRQKLLREAKEKSNKNFFGE